MKNLILISIFILFSSTTPTLAGKPNIPKGINKNLGERGSTFSGGQAQRIVLARALYKNPEIIFLDEATNGLDKKNEQNIFKLLLKLKGKKTLIISSHNQELLNICDYVFEVEKGKIYKKYKVENYIE